MSRRLATVAKLLNKARRGRDHEARLARVRAHEIMAAHGITEAEVKAFATADEEVDTIFEENSVPWREQVAFALATSRGCRLAYLPSGAIAARGPRRASKNAQVVFARIIREADERRESFFLSAGKSSPVARLSSVFRERFNYGFTESVLARLTPLFPKSNATPVEPQVQQVSYLDRRVTADLEASVDRAADEISKLGLIGRLYGEQVVEAAYQNGVSFGRQVNLGVWPVPDMKLDLSMKLLPAYVPTRFTELDHEIASVTERPTIRPVELDF